MTDNLEHVSHASLSLSLKTNHHTNVSTKRTVKDRNRIEVVLVENKRTNKWLAEQLGHDPATISKWCTNVARPNFETLLQIAKLLKVEVQELLVNQSDI